MGLRALDSDSSDPADPAVAAAPATLLVVEDDAAIRAAFLEAMTAEGFVVELAGDGSQALALMTNRPPDLVLLDLMMPKMTGWQVLDEMRKRATLARVPVFIITAAQYAGTVPPGYPIFVKPLSLQYLVRSIRSLLG
jgi:DNA-binding response OmpR family regulator